MNPWPFVIVAYGLTIAAAVALALWSYVTMRSSEKR